MSGPKSRPPQSANSAPVSLAELAQLAEIGATSERIRVRDEESIGLVYIDDGAVVHAELGGLSGLEAAQGMFQRAETSAERLSFVEPPTRTLSLRPSQLLPSFAAASDEVTRHDGARRSSVPASSPPAEIPTTQGTPASGSFPGRGHVGRSSNTGSHGGRTPITGSHSGRISTHGSQSGKSGRAATLSVAPRAGSDKGWLVRAFLMFCAAGGLSFSYFWFFNAREVPANVVPIVVEADALTGLTDVTPRLIEAPQPRKPAKGLAMQPTVLCRVLVGPDGLVAQASVLEPRRGITEYESAALEAVKRYRFKPAQRAGQVVSAWMNVPVSFVGVGEEQIQLRVGGSRGLSRFVEALKGQFAVTSPETRLTTSPTDGAATCIGALLEDAAGICLTTRPMQPFELSDAKALGVEFQEHILGRAHAAVIVHPINPLRELSLAQLSELYRGSHKSWTAVGGEDWPVKLLGTQSDSLPSDIFRESVLGGTSGALPPQFQEMRSSEELFAHVARTPGAIAFAQTQDVAAQTAKANDYIKPLKIRGKRGPATIANQSSIHSKRYPIRGNLYVYSRAQDSPAAHKLLEMLFSNAGRRTAALNDIAVGPKIQLPAFTAPKELPATETFHVEFIAGGVGLDVPARLRLDQVALKLAESEKLWAVVIGNADPVSEPSNQDSLAQTRAEVAERYLTAGGLGKGRVEVRSIGAKRPRSGAVDHLSQHRNRRVDVFLLER